MSQTTTQQQLAALYEVSSQLGSTLDLTELLNLVMDLTIQLTGAERGFIMLMDAYGELHVKSARNVDSENLSTSAMRYSGSVIQRAVATELPILTDNAQEDERFADNQSVVGFQLRSIMCSPLRIRGRVIGVAYVENRLISSAFSDEDLALLNAFSNQAAMAIENARLFQQTDQALNRRIEELSLFQQIDRELNKSLDLNRVLDQALDWAIRLTDADGAMIGLFKENETQQRQLVLEAAGGTMQMPEDGVVPVTHPIIAQLLASGEAIHTTETTAAQALDGSPASVQLVVPIKQEDKIIGILALESHLVTLFFEEDIAFVTRMADRAAVAIRNASLYQEIQEEQAARSQFISLVTHELRLPLTSIRGYSDLLMRGLAGPLSDQQLELLEVVHRNTNRMTTLISDLSDINRLQGDRLTVDLQDVDVVSVINLALDEFKESIEQKGQTVSVTVPESPLWVFADEKRLQQIINNLLSNAHKYTPNGGTIALLAESKGTQVEIKVTDNGIGIGEDDQQRIFEEFFRSEDPAVREEVGWGLGLVVTLLLTDRLDGELSFSSTYGSGSEFSLTFPAVQPTAPIEA